MKIWGRKRMRTCLGMLLIVACFLTSFLFLIIDSNAEEQGKKRESSIVGVVRFTSSDDLVKYIEVDSNREGYFNCRYAGDAAYIKTDSADGRDYVICKLAGVVMRVDKQKYVKEIVPYQNQLISHYSVLDDKYLVHNFTYYSGSTLTIRARGNGIRVGYKPSYLVKNISYYSYDGHYFYDDFEKMISDYRNNTYTNAVNANAPYYNYYQYLSMHTIATTTAEQYDAHVLATEEQYRKNRPNEAVIEPVMLKAGNAFVSTQNKYTINALLTYGVAFNESQWGRSSIARTKNNLFGLNAVDSNPNQAANVFSSIEACIDNFAYGWIHKGYLNGGDSRYRGPHLGDKHSGINVKYASDPYWGEKAAERAYYLDVEKTDYGRYTIGIALGGMISFYKEADVSSKVIYTSDSSRGSYIYDFPVTILEKVTGSNGEVFYKAVSDMSLKDDRSARNVAAIYDARRDYVYVSEKDVKIVFQGGGNIILPENPPQSETPTQPGNPSSHGKTHNEVLESMKVVNTNNYLTGFDVGSDIAKVIERVHALDSSIQITVKKVDGTVVTAGTIATGMTITITTRGTTVDYSVVIRGDVSGDGKLSAIDYVKLRNYLDGANSLSGAYLTSADTSGDGIASALDYVKLRNHLDKKSTIAQ